MRRFSPEELGRCSTCPRTESLNICSRCGERLYCSRACQTKDWESHKPNCKRTTRIDLASFYAILAIMYSSSHNGRPYHIAMERKILNAPTSRATPTKLPDGSIVNLMMLGEAIQRSNSGTRIWWPSAPHEDAITRLIRRLLWHGWLAPNYTFLCISLLITMYLHPPSIPTTKAKPRRIKKLGLHYKGIPIVDFGIGKGSIKVPLGSQFAFWLAQVDKWAMDGKTQQNPDNHYWIYFTTILGNELILDLGMYTYGLSLDVRIDFVPPGIFNPAIPRVPAYFVDKHVAVVDNRIRTTRERFSVLHDPLLAKLSPIGSQGISMNDYTNIQKFMAKVKGAQVIVDEDVLVRRQIPINCDRLAKVLKHHSWDRWPKEGLTGYDPMDDPIRPTTEYIPVLMHRAGMSQCAVRQYLKLWMKQEPKAGSIRKMEDVVKEYRGRL